MIKLRMDKNTKTLLIVLAVVVAVALVWGLIGSAQAKDVGITCDFGLGEDGSVFCWKWHKNTVGKVSDAVNDIFSKKK